MEVQCSLFADLSTSTNTTHCLKSCGNSRLHSRIARRVTRDNVKESNFSFNSIFFTYTFHLFTKKKVWLLYINPWIHYFISWNHIFISQAVHYIKQTVYWVILFIQSSVEEVNIKQCGHKEIQAKWDIWIPCMTIRLIHPSKKMR